MRRAPCAMRPVRAPRTARCTPCTPGTPWEHRKGATYVLPTGGVWGVGVLPLLLCLSCDCCQKGATLSLPTEGVGHSGACA